MAKGIIVLFVKSFDNTNVSSVSSSKCGMNTGDNDRMIRIWFEISNKKLNTSSKSTTDFHNTGYMYAPYNKGGKGRKWYGNLDFVLKYDEEHYNILLKQGNHLPSRKFYFKECITWSDIASASLGVSFRYEPEGTIFDGSAAVAFVKENRLYYLLGLLNTKYISVLANILNPTLHFKLGDYNKLPYIEDANSKCKVDTLVSQNISISKSDWDAHETSWGFGENELVRLAKEGLGQITATLNGEVVMQYHSLKLLIEEYKAHWTEQFLQLHANEEELNRQFIGIYGLEDELTPDVPPEEITILQQGEIRIENGQIVWQNNVIVKQLISYAVGCMLGRYRLDKPGLHIAHPEPTAEETAPYTFNGKQWIIDEDGILPLMSSDTDFADNATLMFKRWLVVAFGEDTLVDNLNYVEAALGKSLDDYFVKDFWKDHKKMYQNRPIYWLFASKKGAFQCLAYMHRMNAYTAERIRTKYLLPHIEWLVQQQTEMEANAANLNARERKQLDSIGRQIAECREYHDRLHTVADEQIAFDLDDGVVVNYAKFEDVLAKLK